ncbi:MAG: hypothetical protein ACT4OK_19845 [Gemmobacter sp.]
MNAASPIVTGRPGAGRDPDHCAQYIEAPACAGATNLKGTGHAA